MKQPQTFETWCVWLHIVLPSMFPVSVFTHLSLCLWKSFSEPLSLIYHTATLTSAHTLEPESMKHGSHIKTCEGL